MKITKNNMADPIDINTQLDVERIFEIPSVNGLIKNPDRSNINPERDKIKQSLPLLFLLENFW